MKYSLNKVILILVICGPSIVITHSSSAASCGGRREYTCRTSYSVTGGAPSSGGCSPTSGFCQWEFDLLSELQEKCDKIKEAREGIGQIHARLTDANGTPLGTCNRQVVFCNITSVSGDVSDCSQISARYNELRTWKNGDSCTHDTDEVPCSNPPDADGNPVPDSTGTDHEYIFSHSEALTRVNACLSEMSVIFDEMAALRSDPPQSVSDAAGTVPTTLNVPIASGTGCHPVHGCQAMNLTKDSSRAPGDFNPDSPNDNDPYADDSSFSQVPLNQINQELNDQYRTEIQNWCAR